MKKQYIYSAIVLLLTLNGTLLVLNSCTSKVYQQEQNFESAVKMLEPDSLELQKRHETICYNGGPGNKSCSIAAGVEINGSTSIGCSVTCIDGYYACCGLSCICRPDNE